MIVISAAAPPESVVTISNVPSVPTVKTAVSPVLPVIVITFPSIATSSTVRAVKVPTLVIFAWAAVAIVPEKDVADSVPVLGL